MAKTITYIALGSNLGDRRATLESAVDRIACLDRVKVTKVSSMIETDPVGPAGQGKYLNGVAQVETTLSPVELLAALHAIERDLGRDRAKEQRWGSRTCDLDIVLMGDIVCDTPELTLPHPRMHERAFVLEPLCEIAPGAFHPVLKKTAAELLEKLKTES